MAERYRHLWILTTLFLLTLCIEDGLCLRNVTLGIVPSAVRRGQNASLICQYDLEGEPLYSVKWYRGHHEFYRYSPSEHPTHKIFPFDGIHVDLSVSDERVVVLEKVGFNLSGNFSCEVTVDAPTFSTKTVTEAMLVVALPESPPVIETEKDRYEPGDILRANCTSPPSKPAASLSFLLNNIPVGTPDLLRYRIEDSLQQSFLSVTMKVFPSHYRNGELVLQCTAYLSGLYRETTEVHLGSRARDPVPERVTSANGTSSPFIATMFHIFLFVMGYLITR